jgi:glycosyltransferase involved in cell wall biosynthesis
LKTNIAVLLPAFNEELTIAGTMEAFHSELPDAQLVVINNNSTDATAKIARDTLARLNAVGLVIDEARQGKGYAIRRAFIDVDAHIYVMADADLTYPAARVHDMILPIAGNEADMVVGDRKSGGYYNSRTARRYHQFGNELVRVLVNSLFGARLVDITSGYRAFSRKFVKNYPILVGGFEIETDMTLHALDKRFRVVEVPVEYKDRPAGSSSKLNTFGDGARVLFTIAEVLRHYRPLAFFGVLGGLTGALGLLAAIPVFEDWVTERYIHHLPLAVLAASLELSAIICLALGLILDSINHLHKRSFEMALLKEESPRNHGG